MKKSIHQGHVRSLVRGAGVIVETVKSAHTVTRSGTSRSHSLGRCVDVVAVESYVVAIRPLRAQDSRARASSISSYGSHHRSDGEKGEHCVLQILSTSEVRPVSSTVHGANFEIELEFN